MIIVVFREVVPYNSLDSIVGDLLPLFLEYEKMQTAGSSKMQVSTYQTTRLHITGRQLHNYHRWKLTSHNVHFYVFSPPPSNEID
jgi:hypothetical protein